MSKLELTKFDTEVLKVLLYYRDNQGVDIEGGINPPNYSFAKNLVCDYLAKTKKHYTFPGGYWSDYIGLLNIAFDLAIKNVNWPRVMARLKQEGISNVNQKLDQILEELNGAT